MCGEYCSAFYKFVKGTSKKLDDPSEIGEYFSDEYGLTTDKKRNDQIIYEWFHKNNGESAEEQVQKDKIPATPAKQVKLPNHELPINFKSANSDSSPVEAKAEEPSAPDKSKKSREDPIIGEEGQAMLE